ncbi:hypothetical protein KDH_15490 [Dictyobacter sp. S3.2.2.5]|uniref:Secreted protein n=1 Tax=Dictyobacter halimunensis TaxID=3026934 RepID=A0ABQ6FLY8_9CHLR|nr:hypothetical protein KDH_15490 [Dictyobacter sp. S3.2.2.5]
MLANVSAPAQALACAAALVFVLANVSAPAQASACAVALVFVLVQQGRGCAPVALTQTRLSEHRRCVVSGAEGVNLPFE